MKKAPTLRSGTGIHSALVPPLRYLGWSKVLVRLTGRTRRLPGPIARSPMRGLGDGREYSSAGTNRGRPPTQGGTLGSGRSWLARRGQRHQTVATRRSPAPDSALGSTILSVYVTTT